MVVLRFECAALSNINKKTNMFETKEDEVNMMENKKEIPKEVRKAYESERAIYEKIADMGIEAYVESLPNFHEAFKEDFEKQFGCIDEGMPGSFETHLAGSGILLSEEEFKEMIERTKPETITSHASCGAAKLYAEKNGLDVSQVDRIYQDWAIVQAKKYGLKYIHISADEMIRPKEGHTAGTCYCDFTGNFSNWDQVNGLPSGFIVSRELLGKEIAARDIALSLTIAFGSHGLGDLLTEENPFLLVAVANNQEQLEAAIKELENIKNIWAEKADVSRDRIRIEGFLAPKEQ